MINHNNEKSQREIFIDELARLKVDVTASDRLAIEKEFGITKSTLSTYLNGQVRDNDTAAKMISFFKKRIADRNLVLV